ncbi:MAG: hypothetical protein JWO10_312 [Microbacteriaceae bacterium]|nr:hypothetical protein [Microbacteriaceae bacterium]
MSASRGRKPSEVDQPRFEDGGTWTRDADGNVVITRPKKKRANPPIDRPAPANESEAAE